MTYNLKATDDRIVDLEGKYYKLIDDLYVGKKVIVLDYSTKTISEHVVILEPGEGKTLTYKLNDKIGVIDYSFGEWRVVGYISDIPQPLLDSQRNPQTLIQIVQSYVIGIEEYGYELKDSKHYIYEAAMKYVYGEDIFKWVNKKLC